MGPMETCVSYGRTLLTSADITLSRWAPKRASTTIRLFSESQLGQLLTTGWEVLDISIFTSGLPFTVYSGIQQTGAGNGGTDRRIKSGSRSFPSPGRSAKTISGEAAATRASSPFPLTLQVEAARIAAALERLGGTRFAARPLRTLIWR